MAIRVMIMAGGTGGHVFPGLAVAEQLVSAGHTVSWLGTRKGIEARLVPEAGIAIDWLSVSGLRGKGLMSVLLAPLMLIKACWQASAIIRKRQPDVVLGFGGFASGPGGLMSWLHRRPLVIHEQNRVPGTTNRLLKGLATSVLEAFPGSFSADVHAICTGNPLRASLKPKLTKAESVACNILVLGGSLGASVLNEVVPEALQIVQKRKQINVIHQAGSKTLDAAKRQYKKMTVEADVCAFIDDMQKVYSWADIVICRAGAMTVSEVSVMGLPAILVPLPGAIDDHQTKNAQYLSTQGAAVLIPQKELLATALAKQLIELVENPKALSQMAKKATQLATPKATSQVLEQCLEAAL
ncbi:MAG: undecaprenyldiphospho-muramoylpentapeptide beta-N-acetylglucosaminyltransferase [Piscirickettsiaceae bacterium]|nr:MAG: undecaprenyldiphospho-muramoylpentapeptide beta-N-acetylglucosaminyltransferase [Piscirickettsiaceae bacterium]